MVCNYLPLPLKPVSDTESSYNWPNSQILECTCFVSHNYSFRTEMCTFLFWMEHCGIWTGCILGFVKLVYCRHDESWALTHSGSDRCTRCTWASGRWHGCHISPDQCIWNIKLNVLAQSTQVCIATAEMKTSVRITSCQWRNPEKYDHHENNHNKTKHAQTMCTFVWYTASPHLLEVEFQPFKSVITSSSPSSLSPPPSQVFQCQFSPPPPLPFSWSLSS